MSAKSMAAITRAQALLVAAAYSIGAGQNAYPAAAQSLEEAVSLIQAAAGLLVLGPSKSAAKKQRATRMTEDWLPSDAAMDWAREQFPSVDAYAETGRMRDWFISRQGDRGLSLDWNANFRNWIRKAQEINGNRSNGGYTGRSTSNAEARRSRLRDVLDKRSDGVKPPRTHDDL